MYAHFNSTMVRLKVKRNKAYFQILQFQFHYGTIKSISVFQCFPLKEHFNSTMVRLKDRLNISVLDFLFISIPLWYD